VKKYGKPIIVLLAAGGIITGMFGFGAQAQQDDMSVASGQALWKQLQAKEIQCDGLTDANYKDMGEYFMQQMMGRSHQATEQKIINRFGQSGLDQMHIAMGKRFSDCDPNAEYPLGIMGYGMTRYGRMPMAWPGYGNASSGDLSVPNQNKNYSMFNNMMGYGYGPAGYGYMGFWGWIFMVVLWAFIIIGIIALVRRISEHGESHHCRGTSALEILKERYARGEIDKKEFEEKKKDLQ
jgi:putative membrane protein